MQLPEENRVKNRANESGFLRIKVVARLYPKGIRLYLGSVVATTPVIWFCVRSAFTWCVYSPHFVF